MAENLGSIYSEIRLRMDKLNGDIAKAKAQLATASGFIDQMAQDTAKRFNDRMKSVSDTLQGVGLAVTGVGVGITAALGKAVTTTANFDKEMSRVRALSGATEADFQKLRQAAIQLGASSVYSASQAAQGMSILAAAGFKTNQILDAMPGILDAAAASGEDFATVTDIMVSAMSGFGLQARDMSHIADVLAAAANASNISIGDLGYTFKYIAPVAKSAGQSLETMAAAAAILGNNGIKAEQAGTTLRMALIRLADPPKEAQKWLERLGVQTQDASGKMLPLANIIGQLQQKFKGLSQAQQLQAASTIFGAESMSGMMALIQAGPEPLNKLTQEFQKADGTAKRMAEDMQNNLAGAWTRFLSALESAAIAIGDQLTPTIQKITEVLTQLVQWFNSLPAPVQQFVAVGLALVGVLALLAGPLLLLIGFLPSIAAGAGLVSSAMAGLGAALGPVIAVVAAVAAAIGLLYLAWKNNFGGIRDVAIQLWEQIKAKFQEAYNVIAPLVSGLINYIIQRWQAIQPVIQPVMQWLSNIFNFVFKFIADTVMFYINAAVNVISGAIKVITGIIKFFVALLTGDWKGAWDAVKQIVSGALQALWGLFNLWIVGRIAGIIGKFVNGAIKMFSGFISRVLSSFSGWVSRMWGLISNWAKGIVQRAWNGMNGMTQAIVKGIGNILSRFGRFVSDAVRSVGRLASNMVSIGRNIVQGLWRGIQSLAGWLKSRILGWARAVLPGPIEDLLGISSPSRLMVKYGSYVAEGLAKGLLRSRDLVKGASEQLAGLTVTAMPSPALASATAESVSHTRQVMNQNAPFVVFENVTVRNDRDLQNIRQLLHEMYQEYNRRSRTRGGRP